MTSAHDIGSDQAGRVAPAGHRPDDAVRAGLDGAGPKAKRPWEVRIDRDVLLSEHWPRSYPRCQVLLVIEHHARARRFAFVGLKRLAEWTHLSRRTVQSSLQWLEETGWITRVYTGPDRRHPLGIIMRRRTSTSTPAADSPPLVARAELDLREHRAQGKSYRAERGQRRTAEPIERGQRRTAEPIERGQRRQNKDASLERDKKGRKDTSEASVRPSSAPDGGNSLKHDAIGRVAVIAAPPPTPTVSPTPTVAPSSAAANAVDAPRPSTEVRRSGPGRDSPVAVELEAKASIYGPVLAAWARSACDHYPAEWVEVTMRLKVGAARDARTPEMWRPYLGRILDGYLRAGRHEYIPGSTLANPSGRPSQPVVFVAPPVDPRQGQFTQLQSLVAMARRESMRRLSGGQDPSHDYLMSLKWRWVRCYLVHLWHQMSRDEQLRFAPQNQLNNQPVGRWEPPRFASRERPTTPAEIAFATLDWDMLSQAEQDAFIQQWTVKPPLGCVERVVRSDGDQEDRQALNAALQVFSSQPTPPQRPASPSSYFMHRRPIPNYESELPRRSVVPPS